MRLETRPADLPYPASTRVAGRSRPEADPEPNPRPDRVDWSGKEDVPRETIGDVVRALKGSADVPLEQTYQWTKDFIAAHPFFHQGLMNLPIGGEKHFRNVPFIGPFRTVTGYLEGDKLKVLKGREVTRGTWDAS